MIYNGIIISLLMYSCCCIDLGYDESNLFNCNNQNYTEDEISDILKLYPIDAFIFVIISPIAILACATRIIMYIYEPYARQIPWDVLFYLSICNIIQCIHYVMSGLYYFIYANAPLGQSVFCQISGTISLASEVGQLFYNLTFVFTPLIVFQNLLKQRPNLFKFINGSILLLSIIITISAYFLGFIDITLEGLCGISIKRFWLITQIINISCLTFYILSSAMALHQLKKVVSQDQTIKELRTRFLKFYQIFVIVTAILWILALIFSILEYFNCYSLQNPKLNIVETLHNFIQAILPIVQTYIQSLDKIYGQKFKQLINNLLNTSSKIELERMETYKVEMIEQQNSIINTEKTDLETIQVHMQLQQVYTLLAGIELFHLGNIIVENNTKSDSQDIFQQQQLQQQYGEKESESNLANKMGQDSLDDNDFLEIFKDMIKIFDKSQADEIITYRIDKNMIQQSIPGKHIYDVFPSKIICHSPEIFKHLLKQDYPMVDLSKSLDLFKNQNKIKTQYTGPDGGKSGEFFYFSWDNKIILKTLNDQELVSIKKRVLHYGQYLLNNPNSLISKIYGIFSFKRLDTKQNNGSYIHVLIMRNISLGVPKKYIQRTFDMKGSEFSREVLTTQKIDPRKKTLKDSDFLKTEKKIWINPLISQSCINALQSDAQFFKTVGLIDYSLLVFKIDYRKYFKDTKTNYKKFSEQLPNQLYLLESVKEKGLYYNIAIIDYLQEWNYNKKAEQITKKIIQLDPALDTSSQSPQKYSQRFQDKLILNIFSYDEKELDYIISLQKQLSHEERQSSIMSQYQLSNKFN